MYENIIGIYTKGSNFVFETQEKEDHKNANL